MPRTWACGSATVSGSPGCSAATSGRPATSSATRSGRSARSGRSTALRKENTPLDALLTLPADAVIPGFWLGAGADDAQDVASAETFWRELADRQPQVPLVITPGGGHNMVTWRAEVPLMLRWMYSAAGPGLPSAGGGGAIGGSGPGGETRARAFAAEPPSGGQRTTVAQQAGLIGQQAAVRARHAPARARHAPAPGDTITARHKLITVRHLTVTGLFP